MALNEVLAIGMVIALCALTLLGFPIAFTLGGLSLIFAGIGTLYGVFDPAFLGFIPNRIYGIMTNLVLTAIPMFIFMGVMLERSKVAETLLDAMGRLFGSLPGGLGISVSLVGALLAASTGIVGATVVTMGLLSLPTLLRCGYQPALASGSIAAAGTLGQIIPPSIVLVILGDQLADAHQKAQGQLGNFAPEPVTVSDLFAGALLPGLALVGFYILYQASVAWLNPAASPPLPRTASVSSAGAVRRLVHALIAPLALIIAVLGSILAGVATPTEAAAVGAVGATLLGGLRLRPERPWPIYCGAGALLLLFFLTFNFDLRLGRSDSSREDAAALLAAGLCCIGIAWGVGASLWRAHRQRLLFDVLASTARFSSMVFVIIIGAGLFSVVFRGFGGDDLVHAFLTDLPGGVAGAMTIVMGLMFAMGFFLDVIEIILVVVPLVAPVLLQMGVHPVWLGVMFAVNLQTSFLTPPLGYALFYLRSVAPGEVSTLQIYKGVIPFVMIQLLMLGLLALFPALTTWLPQLMFD